MALYLKKELEDSKTTIAVWQITETEEQLKEMSSTPTDEMEEISFIKSESLRKQRLAVRALLNELFDEKVYLSHHDNGKPYLENLVTGAPKRRFSKDCRITTWTLPSRLKWSVSACAARENWKRRSSTKTDTKKNSNWNT